MAWGRGGGFGRGMGRGMAWGRGGGFGRGMGRGIGWGRGFYGAQAYPAPYAYGAWW